MHNRQREWICWEGPEGQGNMVASVAESDTGSPNKHGITALFFWASFPIVFLSLGQNLHRKKISKSPRCQATIFHVTGNWISAGHHSHSRPDVRFMLRRTEFNAPLLSNFLQPFHLKKLFLAVFARVLYPKFTYSISLYKYSGKFCKEAS